MHAWAGPAWAPRWGATTTTPAAYNACDPQTGCAYTPVADGTLCNDGDNCTANDACGNGTCVGTPLVVPGEVTSLSFKYWNGTEWTDTWDGTQLGADNKTPLGPPAAIEITLEIVINAQGDTRKYRHVVAIPTANIVQPTS